MAKEQSDKKKLEERITVELRQLLFPPLSKSLDTVDGSETPYNFQFRSSKLPFCSREYVIHHRYSEDTPLKGDTYSFSFYVRVGTAIHEAVQHHLGLAKYIYGHWTCCGVTERHRTGTALCPVCNRPQKYEELAPQSKLGMHVDTVVPKYKAVFEYKSIGSKSLSSLSSPYSHHLIQGSCYLSALNDEFDWGLDKLVFVYFSRDNPKEFRVFVRDPVTVYEDTLAQFSAAKEDLFRGVLPPRSCETATEGYNKSCPYSSVCFRDDLESKLLPASSLLKGAYE